MRRWHDRYRLLGHVDPKSQAGLINVWEALPKKFRGSVRDIQKRAFCTRPLHFGIDRTRHDVARSERAPGVVAFHKIFTAIIAQNSAFTAHCFRDEERFRSEERRVGKECRSRWSRDH